MPYQEKNKKINFTKEERQLLEDKKYEDFIEIYREHLCEMIEAAENRLSWSQKEKIREHIAVNFENISEEIQYKLINKGLIHLTNIKFNNMEFEKIQDTALLGRVDVKKLTSENWKIYLDRVEKCVNTSSTQIHNTIPSITERNSTSAEDKIRIARICFTYMFSGNSHNFCMIEDVPFQVIAEFRPQILQSFTNAKNDYFSRGLSGIFIKSGILRTDQELYEKVLHYAINVNQEVLPWLRQEGFIIEKEEILKANSISSKVLDLYNNTNEFIDENYEVLMKKGDHQVIQTLLNKTRLQDRNEKYLLANPSFMKSLGFQKISETYIDRSNQNKTVKRILNSEFKEALFALFDPNNYLYWDYYKGHPDFKEFAIEKLRETKKANKVRKRSSVLTNGTAAEAVATFIYQKLLDDRIETAVEETWHKYTTIIENKIGEIIYNHFDIDAKIEELSSQDPTFKWFLKPVDQSVQYHLIREIGNFARGTEYFISHLKDIEKNIRILKEVGKVVEG